MSRALSRGRCASIRFPLALVMVVVGLAAVMSMQQNVADMFGPIPVGFELPAPDSSEPFASPTYNSSVPAPSYRRGGCGEREPPVLPTEVEEYKPEQLIVQIEEA